MRIWLVIIVIVLTTLTIFGTDHHWENNYASIFGAYNKSIEKAKAEIIKTDPLLNILLQIKLFRKQILSTGLLAHDPDLLNSLNTSNILSNHRDIEHFDEGFFFSFRHNFVNASLLDVVTNDNRQEIKAKETSPVSQVTASTTKATATQSKTTTATTKSKSTSKVKSKTTTTTKAQIASTTTSKTAASSKKQATPTPKPTTVSTSKSTEGAKQGNKIEVTIYRTKTGTKYHLDGCRHLSKSKIEITVNEAINRKLEPCKHCKPPNIYP